MNNYLLPSDYEFVESIAKAIAKDRLHRDANNAMMGLVGTTLEDSEVFEKSFDHVFESLWNRTTEDDIDQKNAYMADARAAIAAINLNLLTKIV